MWKYIFEKYIENNKYNKVELLTKLETLNKAGVLMPGEYQEILQIINTAFPA